MRLKVLMPDRVLLDREVDKVTAWGRDGSFCLLPRHVDFVSALAPGLLSYATRNEDEGYVAVDEGVLVKNGAEVLVATRNAVSEAELELLKRELEERIIKIDAEEQRAREVVARMVDEFMQSDIRRYGDD